MNLPLAVLVLVAAVTFGVLASLAVAVTLPRLRPWLSELAPRRRAAALTALLAVPSLGGTALSLLALLPGVASTVWPSLDHCLQHDDQHFHLCLQHAPAAIDQGLATAFLIIATVPVVFTLAVTALRVRKGLRLVRALEGNAQSTDAHNVVPSSSPLAITAGLWSPRVYVSTSIHNSLGDESRRAVLAHEAAHVRRRDPLRTLLAEVMAAWHLPHTRRTLLGDLRLAIEELCDAEAGRTVGDRFAVASALVEVGRMLHESTVPTTVGFDGADIELRVRRLLAPPTSDTPWSPSIGAAALAVGLLLCVPLHHLTETALTLAVG